MIDARHHPQCSLAAVRCLFLFCLLISLTPSCSNPSTQRVEKYGKPITKLHYFSPRLLSSEEFKNIVGSPTTNAMLEEWKAVMKATNDAPPFSPQHIRADRQE